jgi:hypothetical protein|tara:strand:+ start:82 stop:333 length:252 start_codon:yes stop_codon:yes gene_type:complete
MKTWKKIEETKKRTNDITNLKKRNEEKVQKKIYDINIQNEVNKQMSQNNYLVQKQRFEEKKKVQDALLLQKKEEAKQSKMIKN